MTSTKTKDAEITVQLSPQEIKAARVALGFSQQELGTFLNLKGSPKNVSRTVRGWESGERNGQPADVPGPVSLLLRAIMESQAVRDYFGLTLRDSER